MSKKAKCIAYILLLLLLPIGTTTSRTGSIFPEDPCAPPCWFGLTPGESTTADVEQFITDYAPADVEVYGLMDGGTGQLITGVVEFMLYEWKFNDVPVQIRIRDSFVYSITVSIQSTIGVKIPGPPEIEESISLRETHVALGEPDHIYFYHGGNLFGHDDPYMTFIYREPRLRIEFQNSFSGLGCNLRSIEDRMFVRKLTYYSIAAANEPSIHVGHDEQQPLLTALHLGEVLVRLGTWQAVLNGELDQGCRLMPTENHNVSTTPLIFDEPDTIRSLFEEDICAPPCWFGLTPGKSTSEDTLSFVQTSNAVFRDWLVIPESDSEFYEQSGLLSSGSYLSNWVFHDRDDIRESGVSILISDDIILEIGVVPNRAILLREVLEKMGTPNAIVVDWTDVTRSELHFMYSNSDTYIQFRTTNQCVVQRISNNFWVDRIVYGTSSSIRRYVDATAVSLETWESWLAGEVEGSCRLVWDSIIDQ